MRINTLCATHISDDGGPSYACQALLEAMHTAGFDVSLCCVSVKNSLYRPYFRLTIPLWGKALGYRLFSGERLKRITEWLFLRSLDKYDLAYLWPGTPVDTFRLIKSRGGILITENVNTHQATSKRILDTEYRRLGINPNHGIDEQNIDDENAKLELVDYVYSPSSEVTKSLLNANVPAEKIIQTSYGCYEHEILPPERIAGRANRSEFTAIFVGRIGIRKGVHLLLDYWVKAGIKGKLKLVGRFEPNAMHLIAPYLKRDDIEHVPFTSDLKSVYSNADVMLFPSLEEGSPLVTYLALGAGLPSIVSPMGGGGVINNGQEGLVVAPHDAEGWVESIRKIYADPSLRQRLASNAYNRANHYTWTNVGRLRAESLQSAISLRVK